MAKTGPLALHLSLRESLPARAARLSSTHTGGSVTLQSEVCAPAGPLQPGHRCCLLPLSWQVGQTLPLELRQRPPGSGGCGVAFLHRTKYTLGVSAEDSSSGRAVSLGAWLRGRDSKVVIKEGRSLS